MYLRLLELLPKLLTGVDEYGSFWEVEDAKLTTSEELIEHGDITIEERSDLDLAIVRLPEDLTRYRVHRFTQQRLAECHPFALHNRTSRSRLLLLQGHRVELQYRYEGWVQMTSRRPALRVDLSELANEMNQEEEGARTMGLRRGRSDHSRGFTSTNLDDVDSVGSDRRPRGAGVADWPVGLESI